MSSRNQARIFLKSDMLVRLVVLRMVFSLPGLSLSLFAVPAQGQYLVAADPNLSPVIGADNLISAHKALYTLENAYLRTKWFDENSLRRKLAGMACRLGKTVLLDAPIDDLTLLVQHEYFGHGFRFREFGFEESSYHIGLPPPYGGGEGRAGYRTRKATTPHERIAIDIAGSEANAVLSNALRLNWVRRGTINYREVGLYFLTANDLTFYILTTWIADRYNAGNDVRNFLSELNYSQGYFSSRDYRLTLDDLARQTLINALNPFQYFSFYTYFKTYLWSGQQQFDIPMFTLGPTRYLPSFRLGLTPFGSEFYFENFLLRGERLLYFYFRYGEPSFDHYWGIGSMVVNLVDDDKHEVNLSFDIWNQPSLILNGTATTELENEWGGAFSGTLFMPISQTIPQLTLMLNLGYKTTGFLQGEKLWAGIIARIGLSWRDGLP